MHPHFFTSDLHLGHFNIIKHCVTRHHLMSDADRIGYDQLGVGMTMSYESLMRHDTAIIGNINSIVPKHDATLWVLGDFTDARSYQDAKAYRDRINCRDVRLIWGNHDNRQMLMPQDYGGIGSNLFTHAYDSTYLFINEAQPYPNFATIDQIETFPNQFRKLREKKSTTRIYLSHYAAAVWWHSSRSCWHLYGHSHGNLEQWRGEHMPNAKSFDVGIDCHNIMPLSLERVTQLMNRPESHMPDFGGPNFKQYHPTPTHE